MESRRDFTRRDLPPVTGSVVIAAIAAILFDCSQSFALSRRPPRPDKWMILGFWVFVAVLVLSYLGRVAFRWYRLKKHGPWEPTGLQLITRRLCIAVAVLWSVCMGLTTLVAAVYNFRLFENTFSDIQRRFYENAATVGTALLYPETTSYDPAQAIFDFFDASQERYVADVRTPPILGRDVPFQTAVVLCDADRDVLLESGDYLFFYYLSEESWADNRQDIWDKSNNGLICISEFERANPGISLLPGDARFDSLEGPYHGNYCYKLTGFWEGAIFRPVKLDCCYNRDDGWDVRSEILKGKKNWVHQFDLSREFPEKDLVTIYVTQAAHTTYSPGGALRDDEIHYGNLLEWVEHKVPHYDPHSDRWYSFMADRNDLFRINANCAYLLQGSEDSEPLFAVMSITGSPLLVAMSQLRWIYLITLFATVATVLALRKHLQRRLLVPLTDIHQGLAANWEKEPWPEVVCISEQIDAMKQAQWQQKQDNQQLRTALSYSRHAEESRRRMVSDITHELKTPLSVIHSYAEGLLAGISEEKKEKYLSVILDETERMDGMVLEMLDLSRLEAGKVKLSADRFFLSTLTEEVLERLALAAEAKALTVETDLEELCTVLSDKARIEQVITNLLTNAIKYTPDGGRIRVKTRTLRENVEFRVENDCQPIPEEAIKQIWEPFYQTDISHSSSGTGLGLAIAKSIVALHGGACSARNTENGVEFRFTLPL